MFSWIPLYEEAATALRAYRDRQPELVQILADMGTAGLKATSVQDKAVDGSRFTLTEIDPFTFLGNFNRGVTKENRTAMWKFLKERGHLQSPLPEDYDGIPLVNLQRAWLMPYADKREPHHVPALWEMFLHILDTTPADLDDALFDRCLALRGVGMAMLTMGFFYARPRLWLALDKRNLAFASANGVAEEPGNGQEYKSWMSKVQPTIEAQPAAFSHSAWRMSAHTEKPAQTVSEADDSLDEVEPQRKPAKVIGLMPFVLKAIRECGGSARLREVYRWVAQLANISDADLQKKDAKGTSVFEKDVRFARQYLVSGKLVDDTELGVWKLTIQGQTSDLTIEEAREIVRKHVAEERKRRSRDSPNPDQSNLNEEDSTTEDIYTKSDALDDLFMAEADLDKIMALWRRKKNLILQGAPGTGKTFIARRLAYLLMEEKDEERVQMVQFHQSSSYEDFIQGIRPDPDGGGFRVQDGVFHRFCRRAMLRPHEPHVLVIDEINRGNLSKVFGELMMLIEPDKRGHEFAMPLSYARDDDERFFVPENVYLIGTMNTADRSLSLVDYALRRRFGFWEMQPGFGTEAFADTLSRSGASSPLLRAIRGCMERLNSMIADDRNNLGSGYRIGHSFFVPANGTIPDAAWLEDIIAHEILPLVEEYWVDDEPKRAEARRILREAF